MSKIVLSSLYGTLEDRLKIACKESAKNMGSDFSEIYNEKLDPRIKITCKRLAKNIGIDLSKEYDNEKLNEEYEELLKAINEEETKEYEEYLKAISENNTK
jgi:hypothetical protein